MGDAKEQIAEPHQTVKGAIVALNNDQKLRWALAVPLPVPPELQAARTPSSAAAAPS